jgi:hypothetical protein
MGRWAAGIVGATPHQDGRNVADSAAVPDVELELALPNAQKTHLSARSREGVTWAGTMAVGADAA